MTCALLAILFPGPARVNLPDLAKRRCEFETHLTANPKRFDSEKLYVMMMNSNGFNEAFYPIGISSRRYLVDYGAGHNLVFQEMRGGVPRSVWQLDLVPLGQHSPGNGTLRRLLAQDHWQIKQQRLTKAQRAALGANVNFAGYSLLAQTDFLRVSFVTKDGNDMDADVYDPNPLRLTAPFLPISPKESALLGYGAKRWYGSGKFDIMHQSR